MSSLPSRLLLGWMIAGAALVAGALPAAIAAAQGGDAGALFPQAFVVEHHLVQTDDDGDRYVGEPVTDYYGGSWIVSVRADGSRRIVDLARREVTEVQPERGTYWTVSFDRLGELAASMRRLGTPGTLAAREAAAAEAGGPARATAGARQPAEPAELVIQELPAAAAPRVGGPAGSATAGARPGPGTAAPGSALGSAPGSAPGGEAVAGVGTDVPAARAGVSRLRVVEASRAAEPAAGLEVWLDPTVRLRAAALDALSSFEESVTTPRPSRPAGANEGPARATGALAAGEEAARPPSVGEQLAAARAHAAGAVPVRTVRSLSAPRTGEPAGTLEDVATRLEPIEALPLELVAVPEGLRRVPHPAEGAVRFLESEAELERALSGRAPSGGALPGGGER